MSALRLCDNVWAPKSDEHLELLRRSVAEDLEGDVNDELEGAVKFYRLGRANLALLKAATVCADLEAQRAGRRADELIERVGILQGLLENLGPAMEADPTLTVEAALRAGKAAEARR